jgi:hypothetical protein
LQTGLIWALAYLAKAVAFPLAFAITIGLALFWKRSGRPAGKVFASLAWTLIPFVLACLPWIITLSIKYHTPTFSTSGRINHSLAGPPNAERYHPFARTFHKPEAGRVTSWEDPSTMKYEPWSPFESRYHALHQLKVILGNMPPLFHWMGGISPLAVLRLNREFNPQEVLKVLPGFDLLYFGIIGLIGCLIGWRKANLAQEKWRWMIVPAICLTGVYLPVFLLPDDQRYVYPLFPVLWVAASGAYDWMIEKSGRRGTRYERGGWRVLVASFGLPALFWLLVALVGIPNPANDVAQDLAARMDKAKLRGPIAGSAYLPGGRVGLFTAYLLNEPWYGDTLTASSSGYHSSRAKFILVRRLDTVARDLDRDRSFENLDSKLFPLPNEAENYPIKVFELK